jgi:hypothetical protein
LSESGSRFVHVKENKRTQRFVVSVVSARLQFGYCKVDLLNDYN